MDKRTTPAPATKPIEQRIREIEQVNADAQRVLDRFPQYAKAKAK
jgi:hypothetical protein